jgi:hypothetical protein
MIGVSFTKVYPIIASERWKAKGYCTSPCGEILNNVSICQLLAYRERKQHSKCRGLKKFVWSFRKMSQRLRKINLLIFGLTLCACTLQVGGGGTEVPTAHPVIKDVAYVDFDSTQIIVKESDPMQVELIISGDLPTPCHELKWEISVPDENKAIHITVYSEIDIDENCAEMLESFEQRISLGEFENTGYLIWINDYKVGEF